MLSKKYGQYKIATCPFCTNQAIVKNKQMVPVCDAHRKETLPDMKCSCGSYVELAIGKWGPYFRCLKCGNVPFRRIMESNDLQAKPKAVKKDGARQEITIRADELDFM